MKPDWIECLIVTSLKDAVSHLPVKHQRLDELGEIIKEIPPDSILAEFSLPKIGHQFLVNKRINAHTAYRLYTKARGNEPDSEPEDIKGLVRSLAAHYHAQYGLIFEVWEYLKPTAVIDGLLNSNDRPGDALKIILDDGFTKAFASIANDDREIKKQVRSIHDRATRDRKNNRDTLTGVDLTIREIAMMSHSWDCERETLHPLLQLLLNIANVRGKRSGVIATASKHYTQTLIDYQREQIAYHRHRSQSLPLLPH